MTLSSDPGVGRHVKRDGRDLKRIVKVVELWRPPPAAADNDGEKRAAWDAWEKH